MNGDNVLGQENMKVLAFNIMSFKSVLYQFRGSNKVTFPLFLMFPYHDLKLKSLIHEYLILKSLPFTRLITKPGVMKQYNEGVLERCLLSLLNFPAISIQYFSVRP